MPNNSPAPNHLIGEQSPYLLQHAYNPVDWHPWGPPAFEKAKAEDKPVLLSVGYSTCHWCHVMAHESFEDQAIAKIINSHFVPIKVDREERPDIDHIYMAAVTAMTGQGGWPLTAFLTPEGEPFYGGTYFAPYAKWGNVGFIDLLNSIARSWKTDKEGILSSGRSLTVSLRRHMEVSERPEKMDEEVLHAAFRHMRGQFDQTNGGFGPAPKFPMGHNLSYLLGYARRTGDAEALDMAQRTLSAMARGGIWDHLGGGFHRYSTDQRWHVPHFEKMLYDQALLARAYLEAYQSTGKDEYSQTARGILDYVLRDMTDGQGGFYSAQDADSPEKPGGHPKEGAFYVFSQAEIEDVLGKPQAGLFCECYGVLPQGNAAFDPHGEFKGKNILYLAGSPQQAESLQAAREKLSADRSRRPRPSTDDKVLCGWNGLMIAAFALAGRVLAQPEYLKAASRCADFLLTRLQTPSGLLHRWRAGQTGIAATLEDYAFLMYGLIELYEAGFQNQYLEAAQKLADRMIGLFADPSGGFFMTAKDAEGLILRPKEIYDGALPSGNSVAALGLWKLHALAQKDIYRTRSEGVFSCFASSVKQAPYAHCFLLSALDDGLQGALEITLRGKPDDPAIGQMVKVVYQHFLPAKTLKFVASMQGPQAQICRRGTCRMPVHSAEALDRELSALEIL